MCQFRPFSCTLKGYEKAVTRLPSPIHTKESFIMATEFDFSAVAVEEAEMPKTAAGRNRKHDVNPFTEVLAASYEAFTRGANAGRQITVPGTKSGEAVYLIRQAADDLGIGARVILRNAKGETLTPKDAKASRGNVTVLFSGKNRKQKRDETPEGTETPEDGSEDA